MPPPISHRLRKIVSRVPGSVTQRILRRLNGQTEDLWPTQSPAADTSSAPWADYNKHVELSVSAHSDKQHAMAQAIGGNFMPFGAVMRALLCSYGLKPEHSVVDIGCGSGRLAFGLKDYLTGPLLGLDVVPALLNHARELTQRPDWTFALNNALTIPQQDASVDFVTAFSLFTHLRHEQSYAYLRDAKRVLRPGGKIVFSFLQFAVPCHWDVFAANIANIDQFQHLNQFMSVDAIHAWAEHLQLRVVAIHDGDKPHVPIEKPVVLDDGRVYENLACMGQSVCVLSHDLASSG